MGVKNIQAAAYNGVRTVIAFLSFFLKEPILECEHLIEKKCHHTYITQFDSEEEEVCEENYEKICQLTFKKEMVTEDVKRCIKSLVKTCDGRGERECKTVDETVCTTKYGEDPIRN